LTDTLDSEIRAPRISIELSKIASDRVIIPPSKCAVSHADKADPAIKFDWDDIDDPDRIFPATVNEVPILTSVLTVHDPPVRKFPEAAISLPQLIQFWADMVDPTKHGPSIEDLASMNMSPEVEIAEPQTTDFTTDTCLPTNKLSPLEIAQPDTTPIPDEITPRAIPEL